MSAVAFRGVSFAYPDAPRPAVRDVDLDVSPGELLLVIDRVPFQLQVDQAEAQLQATQAALAKTLASKDPDVAKAQVDLDGAQVLLDKAEERRSRSLLARVQALEAGNGDHDEGNRQKPPRCAHRIGNCAGPSTPASGDRLAVDVSHPTGCWDAADRDGAFDCRGNLGWCADDRPGGWWR